MRKTTYDQVALATEYLAAQTQGRKPIVGLVLGSGFSNVMESMNIFQTIPYTDIPCFPQTTVHGHPGNLHFGQIQDVEVLVMQGRFHFYEGHDLRSIAIPIRVFKNLGVETMFLTNAAGSINTTYRPGDLMIIEDHLNLSLANPLMASDASRFGAQFPDTSLAYTPVLVSAAERIKENFGLRVQKGVYTFTTGPSYETPAEIRMMRILGGDVVGMSTFPEALVAHQAGLRVFGLSMVSNYGSGISDKTLDHNEIMETMSQIKEEVRAFLSSLIGEFATL